MTSPNKAQGTGGEAAGYRQFKSQGAIRITQERARQVEEKHWDAAHDDEYDNGELALAAIAYAAPEPVYVKSPYAGGLAFTDPYPWPDYDRRPEKPTPAERIRMLEKAGALIAAEIDRLLRLTQPRPNERPEVWCKRCGGSGHNETQCTFVQIGRDYYGKPIYGPVDPHVRPEFDDDPCPDSSGRGRDRAPNERPRGGRRRR